LALGGQPGQVMAVGGELIRLEVEGAGNLAESPAAGGGGGGGGAAPRPPPPPPGGRGGGPRPPGSGMS
ncbi:2-oxo acid dehydrogenase subunit E2, partial [Pseudomonas aeruginosa]|nr:2-oxo acid dehydrogenase subunit E2 [Pseudomonas aeruginosa]